MRHLILALVLALVAMLSNIAFAESKEVSAPDSEAAQASEALVAPREATGSEEAGPAEPAGGGVPCAQPTAPALWRSLPPTVAAACIAVIGVMGSLYAGRLAQNARLAESERTQTERLAASERAQDARIRRQEFLAAGEGLGDIIGVLATVLLTGRADGVADWITATKPLMRMQLVCGPASLDATLAYVRSATRAYAGMVNQPDITIRRAVYEKYLTQSFELLPKVSLAYREEIGISENTELVKQVIEDHLRRAAAERG